MVDDLKTVYQAAKCVKTEARLRLVADIWAEKYPISIKFWENKWDDLATIFDFPKEIRRLIYTTNIVEGYHRQLRRVTKTKAFFPNAEAGGKLRYLVTQDIQLTWSLPVFNWPSVLNHLAIRFDGRLPID